MEDSMESNNTNPINGINVEAEKNILNNFFSTNEDSSVIKNILKDDIKLPESLKFNTNNDVNNIQNILPESLKFDLNIMSNFKNEVENIKNDVTSVQQQPLESSLKLQVENIQNQFDNAIHQFEIPKQAPISIDTETKTAIKPIPNIKNISLASNSNELNSMKASLNDSTKHIHNVLKELESRVNAPKPSDSYEERVTINPNNLIFNDRKQTMSEYPHWS